MNNRTGHPPYFFYLKTFLIKHLPLDFPKNFCYTKFKVLGGLYLIMIILALDLSTKSSGYAIFNNQELIKHGYITAGSSNLYHRIHKMTDEIKTIAEENKVEKAVIEDVIPDDVKGNQKVFKALMYLQGFITDVLDSLNIPFIFYTASEWRKKCKIHTGRGVLRESLKPKDIEFVQNQFGIKVNDDEADAICLGFAEVGGEIKAPQVIVDDSGFEFA